MSPAATAATFATFYGEGGSIGPAFLTEAGVNLSIRSVHHSVVTTGVPMSAPQIKKQFGHAVTVTKARELKGTPLFQTPASLLLTMKKQFMDWNTLTPVESRLVTLQRQPVGGMLAVVQHWNPATRTFSPAVIRLLAAPSIATLGDLPVETPPGLLLSDVWDPDIVSPVLGDLPLEESCPIMAGTAGLSRKMSDLSMQTILQTTAPVFIPDGVAASAIVTQGTTKVTRVLFLPELAHMPVGHCWPIEGLTLTDIEQSIQLATSSRATVCAPFITLLHEAAPIFQAWLTAVQANPRDFQVKAYYFQNVEQFFPALTVGTLPAAIVNIVGFSPLMDMRSLYTWRVAQDILFSMSPQIDVLHLKMLMEHAAPALVANSYVGDHVLPAMCPNFPYHFRAHGGWPTESSLLEAFHCDANVSHVAKQHDLIEIDVQPKGLLTTKSLLTRDQQSSIRHANLTPLASIAGQTSATHEVQFVRIHPAPNSQQAHHRADAPPFASSIGGGTSQFDPGHTERREEESPSRHLFSSNSPSETGDPRLYSPVPPPNLPAPASRPTERTADPRALGFGIEVASQQRSFRTLPPVAAAVNQPMRKVPIREWSVSTEANREFCSSSFLGLCFLLSVAVPDQVLYTVTTPVQQLLPDQCIFAREPTAHFRVEVMDPLQSNQAPLQVVTSAHEYIMGLFVHFGLRDAGSLYSSSFFAAANLKKFLAVGTWSMSATARASEDSFTVYHFLRCLPEFARATPLIPPQGLKLLHAKHVARFVQTWFRSMDMMPGRTSTCRFDSSQLGRRVVTWVSILDSPQVHALWDSHPAVMTYQWFDVLRSLLEIFAGWRQQSRWITHGGFGTARTGGEMVHLVTLNGDIGPDDSVQPALRSHDADVKRNWDVRNLHVDHHAFFYRPPPASHFRPVILPPLSSLRQAPPGSSADQPVKKKAKPEGAVPSVPDFVNTTPLCQLVAPLRTPGDSVVQLARRSTPPATRMPRLIGPIGESLVCFRSLCSAPNNRCRVTSCGKARKNGPLLLPVLHIDLSCEPWKSKAEAYWQPFVLWLQLPSVSAVLQPSPALVALTPATTW